jgi:hypothetical protein
MMVGRGMVDWGVACGHIKEKSGSPTHSFEGPGQCSSYIASYHNMNVWNLPMRAEID